MTNVWRAAEGRASRNGWVGDFRQSWRPRPGPRGRRHLPRRALPAVITWVAEQFVASGLAVYAGSARPRKSDGERFSSRSGLSQRRGRAHPPREITGAGAPGVPARSQRRRRLLRLHARAPGRARGPDLRRFRVRGSAEFARGPQGAEPPRATRPRAQAADRGLFPQSRRRRRDEQRPADRSRGPADEDGRRAGPRRRAEISALRCRSSFFTAPPTRSPGRAAAGSSTAAARGKTKLYEDTSTICSATSIRKSSCPTSRLDRRAPAGPMRL